MEIIPAIDIRGGRCVRLEQGDYSRETVFSEDPTAMASRWQNAGANRLHIVDLDGAREGRPVNQDTVRRMLAALSIPAQVGGGIRDLTTIESYLQAGVDRIILGTAAIKEETLLREAIARYPDRIAVAVDARAGVVVTEGWRETSDTLATNLIEHLAGIGVTCIIYTDTLRDGTLTGPNYPAITDLLSRVSSLPNAISLICGGGLSSLEDLHRLAALNVPTVIIGKALYTGDIDFAQALAALTP